MKTVAATILRRFGFRAVLTANAVIASLLIGAIGLFTPDTPHWLIVTLLLVGGCLRSLQFTSLTAIAYAEVSGRDMSSATSLTSVAQQLSLSVGVAVGAFALEAVSRSGGAGALQAGDFWPAFLLVSAVSATSALVVARLHPNAGAEMSGHLRVERKPAADGG
jgi:hypothetical protein